MNFALTDEQQMIVDTVRAFVETEIYPHENEVERTGHVPPELGQEIARKCKEIGLIFASTSEGASTLLPAFESTWTIICSAVAITSPVAASWMRVK